MRCLIGSSAWLVLRPVVRLDPMPMSHSAPVVSLGARVYAGVSGGGLASQHNLQSDVRRSRWSHAAVAGGHPARLSG